MKPDQDDRLEARGVFSQPRECSAESLRPPEIVAKLKTRCSKWFVVSGGEHSIACLVASCPFGCGSSIEYTDQNRPYPPTCNARPITIGWSKPLQWPVKQSNQQNSMPGQIKAAYPAPAVFPEQQ
jgi:hypothetical protein